MWIFLPDAMFSIVAIPGAQKKTHPDPMFVVRSRRIEDLARYFNDGRKIHETPHRDYGFRVFASRDDVIELLTMAVIDLDYPNFKDAVAPNEKARKAAYSRVWQAMADFQLQAPYGGKLDTWPSEYRAGHSENDFFDYQSLRKVARAKPKKKARRRG